ncbi:MAG TPA: hypothetical protein PLY30_04305, partial [Candidatus Omnitrophota bacterium]|nr:hypothetical protein [Candidatus Omnitrophota bacterium]
LGTRQSGVPFFRVADLLTDEAMLILARDRARTIVDALDLDALKNPGHWIHKYLGERNVSLPHSS